MTTIQAGKTLGARDPRWRVASATNITVPAHAHRIRLTGTTTVATIKKPGRVGTLLCVEGSADGSVTITNNNDPTTAGQIDLGGSNLALGGIMDSVLLRKQANETWEKVFATDL